MQKQTILFIGHIAPPLGGVAVHIARLAANMKKVCHVDFIDESPRIKSDIFNIRAFTFKTYCSKVRNADVVHIHSSDWRLRFFHILFARLFQKKIIITLHSFRCQSRILLALHKKLLKIPFARIFVSKDIQQKLGFLDATSFVQEAYLPPLLESEPPLPQYLLNEIDKAKKQHAKILVSNASRLDDFHGHDLYGLDLAIDLIEHLSKCRQVVCFFIVSSLDKHAEKFHSFQQQYIAKGLEANFILLYENLSFPLLIQTADAVLRLTNTDGDSLTVREALEFNVTPIASDVVQRPAGTILFKNRDLQDLITRVEMVLDTPPTIESRKSHAMDFYYDLYDVKLTECEK